MSNYSSKPSKSTTLTKKWWNLGSQTFWVLVRFRWNNNISHLVKNLRNFCSYKLILNVLFFEISSFKNADLCFRVHLIKITSVDSNQCEIKNPIWTIFRANELTAELSIIWWSGEHYRNNIWRFHTVFITIEMKVYNLFHGKKTFQDSFERSKIAQDNYHTLKSLVFRANYFRFIDKQAFRLIVVISTWPDFR